MHRLQALKKKLNEQRQHLDELEDHVYVELTRKGKKKKKKWSD